MVLGIIAEQGGFVRIPVICARGFEGLLLALELEGANDRNGGAKPPFGPSTANAWLELILLNFRIAANVGFAELLEVCR